MEAIIAVLLINSANSVICRKLVLGSDDEILTPLFEKNDVSIAVSASHDHSRSSKSKKSHSSKSRRTSRTGHDYKSLNSHLKMNLDLPSIQSSSGSDSQQSLKEFGSVPLESSLIQANKAQESKITVKNVQEKVNFNIPFVSVNPEDLEVVVIKQVPKKVIAPGPIITGGRKVTVKPGAVIVSKVQAGVVISGRGSTIPPGTIVGTAANIDTPSVIPALAEIPFSESCNDLGSTNNENKQTVNLIISSTVLNKPEQSGKQKKVHALEEYTIYSLKHENDYSGPKIDLSNNITVEYVNSVLIPYFKSGKILDRKSAYSVTITRTKIQFITVLLDFL